MREDEKIDIIKTQKSSKGRVKQKKITLEEILPSPVGRRIQPVIDHATKVKAEKEVASKKRQQVSADSYISFFELCLVEQQYLIFPSDEKGPNLAGLESRYLSPEL